MVSRLIAAVAFIVAASSIFRFCNDDSVARCGFVDLSKDIPEWQAQFLEEHAYGRLDKVRVCKIGSYLIYAPDDADRPNLFVRTPQEAVAMIDNDGLIALFEEDRPFLTVDDKDKDGKFDWLSYDVYRDGYADYLGVLDSNLDGQADSRTEHVAGQKTKAWLWFDGSWRPIRWLNAPEPNRILVDGEWKRYEKVDDVLVLLDDE